MLKLLIHSFRSSKVLASFLLMATLSYVHAQPLPIGKLDPARDLLQTVQLSGIYASKSAFTFNVMGRRAGFTSISILNDVVEFANGVANIPVLTGLETLEVVSSNVNDNSIGTGVRAVKVTYINTSNNLVESLAIPLNGVTPVAAGFTAIEPLWMESSTVGSGGVAAGNIRLRTVVGSVECEQVTAGDNKSMSGRFMIPTGYTGYLSSWNAHATNNDQDLRLRATVNSFDRSLSTVYHIVDKQLLALNTNSLALLPFIRLAPLSRVKVSTFAGATGAAVKADVSFVITIIQN